MLYETGMKKVRWDKKHNNGCNKGDELYLGERSSVEVWQITSRLNSPLSDSIFPQYLADTIFSSIFVLRNFSTQNGQVGLCCPFMCVFVYFTFNFEDVFV